MRKDGLKDEELRGIIRSAKRVVSDRDKLCPVGHIEDACTKVERIRGRLPVGSAW